MAEDRHRLGHAAPGLGQILRRVLAEPVNGEVVDPGSFRIAVAVQGHLVAQRCALGYRAF